MIDQKMIMAINELATKLGKTPRFKSMPGLPDFEWDAAASGFELPAPSDVDTLATAWHDRIRKEMQQLDEWAAQ